ncbi:MAG: hypothetical protein M3Z57_05385 [Candidatus Dormibacteraeota bacterium]|nr:hypothetical protein [Candidatus Dormibacteraeota bacterium]
MTDYWQPRTEADIQAGIDQDLVRESHVFDAKQQAPPPTKNMDIAVDLASFAVDGGSILYGVRQPSSTGATTLAPFDITGLPERLDQIARGGTIDPPLTIRVLDIPSKAQAGRGYLWVHIPPSSDAPHAVDGRFRGRSDRTNMVLSSHAVTRLIAAKAARAADAHALLAAEVARDPTPAGTQNQLHLFVVAQPATGRRDLLSQAIGTQNWRPWIEGPFKTTVRTVPSQGEPDLFNTAGMLYARVDGWAVSTYEMGDDRSVRPSGPTPVTEGQLLDFEIRDDGGLRLFCGRASTQISETDRRVVPGLIATLTQRVLLGAVAVADKSGYQGAWTFGLALRGPGAVAMQGGALRGYVERQIEPYEETALASIDDLRTRPDEIARSLLGRFYRAFGFLDQVPGLSSSGS